VEPAAPTPSPEVVATPMFTTEPARTEPAGSSARQDGTAAADIDPTSLLDAIAVAVQPAPVSAGPETGHGSAVADDDDAAPAVVAAAPSRPSRTVRTGPAMRPELFPASPKRAPGLPARRRPRVSADSPAGFDVPEAPTTPVLPANDGLDMRLAAAVAIPRPVFISDLVDQVGSADEVEAWVERCRADADSPYRFIPTKARHRLRGSLVLPVGYLREAAAEFSQSWWAECLERFHGAKLYEMAVLLHAIGDQVKTWKVTADGSAVLMRVAQQRGIVGVVVCLDDRLAPTEAGRSSVASLTAELLKDRLDLLVVLATTDPMLEPLVTAITDEAASRRWEPTCHVVAARSWEWASGNAAAARHVLG
jgi:hypothetical protein